MKRQMRCSLRSAMPGAHSAGGVRAPWSAWMRVNIAKEVAFVGHHLDDERFALAT
jgi:hypothetical protein